MTQGPVILLAQDFDASTDGVRLGTALICVSFGSTEDLSDCYKHGFASTVLAKSMFTLLLSASPWFCHSGVQLSLE